MQRTTLAAHFEQFAGLADVYLRYDNGYRSWTYTYAQVGAAARHFAGRLQRQGIGKDGKVIFWSENRPEWVAAFWGCVIAGVVVVPMDFRASPDFLRKVGEQVEAALILTGDEVPPPLPGGPAIWRFADFEWPPGAAAAPAAVEIQPDDVAEIVFTSGATGEPKGVLITHRNIVANLDSPEALIRKYVKWFRPVFPLRFLCLVPLSHMFGQALTMFIVPLLPGVAVFMHGLSPHEIVRQIRTGRVSVAVVVPKLLDVLREYVVQRFPEANEAPPPGTHWTLRWWRYRSIHWHFGLKFWVFVCGAAALEREVEEFWLRLGFPVIQGYGLTETAPIISFNNPFAIRKGTVGRPVKGMEVRIAEDGEILVRGASVTPGYYGRAGKPDGTFDDGWLRTGDLGELDESGRLTIRGRKKEMIVTPEGLNVFPQDIERVLNAIAGVSESAVVGRKHPHAVLILEDGISPEEIIRVANQQLEDHQKIRGLSVWRGDRLPRTAGTEKMKRAEIQKWVDTGEATPAADSGDPLLDLVRRYAPGRAVTERTTLDQLGLSSLDRVELLMDLEQHLDTSIDETALTGSRALGELGRSGRTPAPPPATDRFPVWSRTWPARMIRRGLLALVLLPLARLFAWPRIRGREHLQSLTGPVIFASNHQSHFDTPCILAALPRPYRYRVGVAMWKEFFDAHFHPERHSTAEWLGDSFLYGLLTLLFHAFPLPQREACVSQSLRYLGDLVSTGWSILFFPEGRRTDAGEIRPFQPGIGLIASRLDVQVVPIRLRGVDQILHRTQWFPRPGRFELTFGEPLTLEGDNYAALAKQVEEAVRAL